MYDLCITHNKIFAMSNFNNNHGKYDNFEINKEFKFVSFASLKILISKKLQWSFYKKQDSQKSLHNKIYFIDLISKHKYNF
jgi:hypothetical protein